MRTRYLNDATLTDPESAAKILPFVKPTNWLEIKNVTAESADVYIYDEISPYTAGSNAKDLLGQLKNLKDVPTLNVRINSPGGSVFEGMAMYNALSRHAGNVVVHVDGLAASIASVIAMAGKEINIAENAMMMIHNPMAITFGTSVELRKQADVLDQIKESILNTYCTRTGKKRDTMGAMMDAETWFTAEEAVKNKLADKCAKPMKMAACFDIKNFGFLKVPEELTTPSTPPPEPVASSTTAHSLRLRRLALHEKI